MNEPDETIETPAITDDIPPFPEQSLDPEDIPENFPEIPYANFSEENRLILAKLDGIYARLDALSSIAQNTNQGVNWIGTNFQTLLQTVSNIGANPLAMLKALKGGRE